MPKADDRKMPKTPLVLKMLTVRSNSPVREQEQHGNNEQPGLEGHVLCSHFPILLTNRTWPLKRGFSGHDFLC